MTKGKYQFIKWSGWVGIGYEAAPAPMDVIYDWYLRLGFWEVRRWTDDWHKKLMARKG